MFSVVTISRDRPKAFERHLRSLSAQRELSEKDWELIIIDDSTKGDNRQERAIRNVFSQLPKTTKAFRAQDREVYGGEGKSINFGIKQTSGDPIFVLCGDDLFPTKHFDTMDRIYSRMVDSGKTKLCLGWPLYHLRPSIPFDQINITSVMFDYFVEDRLDLMSRREEMSPDWPPGVNVFSDGIVDDRAAYSREFLFGVKGWPEWEGCWWRDAWMRAILYNNGYEQPVDWAGWSLHQWHHKVFSPGDQQAKDIYDEKAGTALVSNEGDWGIAPMERLKL